MRQRIVQAFSILLCIIIVSSLALLVMGWLDALLFWVLAAIAAFCAFAVVPWLKKT